MPRVLFFLMATLMLAAAAATAQEPLVDSRRAQATRRQLEAMAELYEKSAASSAYSAGLRSRARLEAERIRERLARGDFQVGDRVVLSVERETDLTSTFIVTDGPSLILPRIREISLSGVLRSELEDYLRAQIGRFVENPQVHAHPTIRVSIIGAVPQPGFYAAPSDALITEVVRLAGGPTPASQVDEIKIEREGRTLYSEAEIRQASFEGRTLDDLDIRPGDRIRVPQRGAGGLGVAETAIRWSTMLMSLPITIFSISRIF